MATPFPGWVLDSARNQYYYFSAAENAYIYQNGEKIHLSDAAASSSASKRDTFESGEPRTSGSRAWGGRENIHDLLQTSASAEITDPELAALGLQARGRLRGAPRDHENLFPGTHLF